MRSRDKMTLSVCVYSNSRNDVSEWLSSTEPLPHTTAPCIHLRCVCSVLHAHVQFCRFDKADATADVQRHCNHRSPL